MTSTKPVVAGLEMGGTKCVLTLARGADDILAQATVPTRAPDATLADIETRLDQWFATTAIRAIGIAAFGPLQLNPDAPDFGAVIATPKPGWSGINSRSRLLARYRTPVVLQTDVNGAALAEQRWGAARGLRSHAYITIGTGVGVGLVVDGRPVMGLTHPEAGHIRAPRAPGDDWPGCCPFHGDCIEGLISGPAIAARHGRPGHEIGANDASWGYFTHTLAGLLHALALILAPERISIGGGVMTSRPELFDAVRRQLATSLNGYGDPSFAANLAERLGPPGLGDRAGPLGAIAVALDGIARG